ncbi:MAG: hypothetical protein GF347_02005 [Candidatus Moranbacteria bacterium]|nr:hypothetical protein [Candidatus Moranbacteria bacterium]
MRKKAEYNQLNLTSHMENIYQLSDAKVSMNDERRANLLGEVARDLGSQNLMGAQSKLEQGNVWDDDMRAVAVDLSEAEGNLEQLNLMGALGKIDKFASDLESSGDRTDFEFAQSIRTITNNIRTASGLGNQIEALDQGLEYIEGLLFSTSSSEKAFSEKKDRLDQRRSIRNALFREKEKLLKNLEVSRDEVEIPEDRRGLVDFSRKYFKKAAGMKDINGFGEVFSEKERKMFRGYVDNYLKMLIGENTSGMRYPDTVASVLGNDGTDVGIVVRLISEKVGKVIKIEAILRESFSDVYEYIFDENILNVHPEYEQYFNKR